MNGIEDDLKHAFDGGASRPPWNEIERRAAGIRRRRQRTRAAAAVGVLALITGVGVLVSQTRSGDGADQRADRAPDDTLLDETSLDETGPEESAALPPAVAPIEELEACPPPLPAAERPLEELMADLAAFLAEVEETGLTQIGYSPDCTVVAYVAAEDFVELAGVPHADLQVFDESGEHIGWLVPGLPAMTIAQYEADPEAARQLGLERLAELTEGLDKGSP